MKWSRTFFSSTKSFKLSWRNTSRLHVSFLAFATRATLFPETETMPHDETMPHKKNNAPLKKKSNSRETVPHYRNSAQIEKQSNLKNFFLSLVKLKDKFKFMHVLSRLQIHNKQNCPWDDTATSLPFSVSMTMTPGEKQLCNFSARAPVTGDFRYISGNSL